MHMFVYSTHTHTLFRSQDEIVHSQQEQCSNAGKGNFTVRGQGSLLLKHTNWFAAADCDILMLYLWDSALHTRCGNCNLKSI